MAKSEMRDKFNTKNIWNGRKLETKLGQPNSQKLPSNGLKPKRLDRRSKRGKMVKTGGEGDNRGQVGVGSSQFREKSQIRRARHSRSGHGKRGDRVLEDLSHGLPTGLKRLGKGCHFGERTKTDWQKDFNQTLKCTFWKWKRT